MFCEQPGAERVVLGVFSAAGMVSSGKPGLYGFWVNKKTLEAPLGDLCAKVARVEGTVGGDVLIVVDLAAWCYLSTGWAVATVLRHIHENLNELSFEWLLEQLQRCEKLAHDLEKLREVVEALEHNFKAKGATTVTVRFVAEMREHGELKTHKRRDNLPLDPERFVQLGAAMRRKKPNINNVMGWWRQCCRGPDGYDWQAVGAAVLWAAVNKVFAGMGERVVFLFRVVAPR